jgi:hypothetical protein
MATRRRIYKKKLRNCTDHHAKEKKPCSAIIDRGRLLDEDFN